MLAYLIRSNIRYVLNCSDLDRLKWRRVNAKGSPPEARSGHAACAVRDRDIIVCGGWNSHTKFQDIHIFNTKTCAWTRCRRNLTVPRWGHSICSVEAIPFWKLFVFGGSTQQENDSTSEYSNDVVVMDACGDDVPVKSTITRGDLPPPRMSSAVAYDVRGSRILVSSGWANQWYDDTNTLYTLNVGRIVGPPYTVNALEPRVGPVTGGILVRIEGVDFVNKLPIVVRFATRRHFVDAEGEFVNDGELLCTLPSFEKCGPSDVQVRVSIKGDSFTTTYQKFNFFQVTDHANCTAFGPGLIDGGTAGFTTLFHIVAVDKDGNIRTSGGDEFDVHIAKPDGGALPYKIQDNENGDYVVAFEPKDSGPYEISVSFKGTFQGIEGPLRGSPFKVNFDDHGKKEYNRMDGPLVTNHLKTKIRELLDFAAITLAGIQVELMKNDFEGLLKVKEHLRNIDTRNEELQTGFDVCAATIRFLRSYSIPWLEDVDLKLQEAGRLWRQARDTADTTAVRVFLIIFTT